MTLEQTIQAQAEKAELIKRLVEVYRKDVHRALAVAIVCDEVIDRSGALLGKVREQARYPNAAS